MVETEVSARCGCSARGLDELPPFSGNLSSVWVGPASKVAHRTGSWIRSRPPGARRRVLAVFEPGDSGEATLREAAELAEAGCALTVVTLAPQAGQSRCCSKGGTGPYNIALRDEARIELRHSAELLGATARRASFTVLAGCPDPPLGPWALEQGFDLILLPSHRFTRGGNRYARALRRSGSAEVRTVS